MSITATDRDGTRVITCHGDSLYFTVGSDNRDALVTQLPLHSIKTGAGELILRRLNALYGSVEAYGVSVSHLLVSEREFWDDALQKGLIRAWEDERGVRFTVESSGRYSATAA